MGPRRRYPFYDMGRRRQDCRSPLLRGNRDDAFAAVRHVHRVSFTKAPWLALRTSRPGRAKESLEDTHHPPVLFWLFTDILAFADGYDPHAVLYEKTPPHLCICGHPHSAHQHYRRGTECSLCADCPRWRPRLGRMMRVFKRLLSPTRT